MNEKYKTVNLKKKNKLQKDKLHFLAMTKILTIFILQCLNYTVK